MQTIPNLLIGICVFAIFAIVTPLSVQSQTERVASCDLTYRSILQQNDLEKDEWIQRWLETYGKSPAQFWLSSWNGGPIESSVLIEHPAFHAGERTTIWLVRTKSAAFYLESVQSDSHSVEEVNKRTRRKSVEPANYDRFLETASGWKQASPLKPGASADGFSPEVFGFLTISSNGSCKQMLLGVDDLLGCTGPDCKKAQLGRVYAALSTAFPEWTSKKSR